ncbi:hypothetical protein EDC01DRAFT_671394 [Geopyxis carbonaria]|nr:hypothetical protein EDC01DRAFT_671394 [Geopyxis carbonaria]
MPPVPTPPHLAPISPNIIIPFKPCSAPPTYLNHEALHNIHTLHDIPWRSRPPAWRRRPSTSTLGLSFSVSGTALTALPSSLPTPLETLSLSLSINTAATARRPVFPTGRIRPQPTNACTVTYAPTDTLLLEDSGSGKNNTVTTTEQKCLQDCYPDAQAKVFSKCPMMEPHQCHCLNAVRRWCALGCGVKWVGIVGCPSAPRGGVGAL